MLPSLTAIGLAKVTVAFPVVPAAMVPLPRTVPPIALPSITERVIGALVASAIQTEAVSIVLPLATNESPR